MPFAWILAEWLIGKRIKKESMALKADNKVWFQRCCFIGEEEREGGMYSRLFFPRAAFSLVEDSSNINYNGVWEGRAKRWIPECRSGRETQRHGQTGEGGRRLSNIEYMPA